MSPLRPTIYGARPIIEAARAAAGQGACYQSGVLLGRHGLCAYESKGCN